MGCDIHLYVEKKINGVWEAVKGANPDIENSRRWAKRAMEQGSEEQALHYEKRADDIESGEMLKKAEDEYDRSHYSPTVLEGWAYEGRNYDLFSILADVRNGYGFAGSYTGEGFKPMSEPKGVPDDMSDEIKKAYVYWEGDGHSHSYFTARELLDYDWEQNTQTLKGGFYPVLAPKETLQDSLEVTLYKDCAGSFYTDTIPKLKEVAEEDFESVRIIFWFDN